MGRPIGTQEVQEIEARYRQGDSVKAIGAAIGRAPGVVHRVLQRSGVPTRSTSGRARRDLTANERGQAVALYGAGASIPAIARQFACSVSLVTDVLIAGGVTLRRRGGQPKVSQAKRAAILAAWEDGLSATAISARLKTSSSTVKSVVIDAGLTWETRLRSGSESPSWKGGKIALARGYQAVHVPRDSPYRAMANGNGYVAEHRLVMATALGRALEQHETVHHINGDRADNRLENLQLRSGRHGKGVAMTCLDCGSHNIASEPLSDPKVA